MPPGRLGASLLLTEIIECNYLILNIVETDTIKAEGSLHLKEDITFLLGMIFEKIEMSRIIITIAESLKFLFLDTWKMLKFYNIEQESLTIRKVFPASEKRLLR